MSRHWSINGRFLTQSLSGVQRYAHEIVRQLDKLIEEEHELTRGLALDVLTPPGAKALPHLQSVRVRAVGGSGGHLWEQAVLPRYVSGGLLSLCNTGPVSLPRQIVCIHDVNTRSAPQSYSLAFRSLYRVLHPALGRRVARVATVSHYSASQLVHYGIASEDKITVIPNGHEHATRWTPAHSDRTLPFADGRTVVCIGSPAPHKNMELLLGIADELARAGLRLAIVGMRDARVFNTPPAGHDSANVVWLGRLSDNEIAALLADALCLAFPSLAEGFGLPVIEAMSWGCPVISSDCASLPEVGGEAVLLVSPRDPTAWRDQIIRLADNHALRAALSERGRLQAAKFSWRASAQAYLRIMAEIDG